MSLLTQRWKSAFSATIVRNELRATRAGQARRRWRYLALLPLLFLGLPFVVPLIPGMALVLPDGYPFDRFFPGLTLPEYAILAFMAAGVARSPDRNTACQHPEDYDPSPLTYLDCAQVAQQHRALQVSETLEVAAMTLLDGGALLRISLMRSAAPLTSIARNLFSAGLGLVACLGLTYGALRAAAALSRRDCAAQ